jgi:hypothetical protein
MRVCSKGEAALAPAPGAGVAKASAHKHVRRAGFSI